MKVKYNRVSTLQQSGNRFADDKITVYAFGDSAKQYGKFLTVLIGAAGSAKKGLVFS